MSEEPLTALTDPESLGQMTVLPDDVDPPLSEPGMTPEEAEAFLSQPVEGDDETT